MAEPRALLRAGGASHAPHPGVDFARAQGRKKRGGGVLQVSLAEAPNVEKAQSADLVALDDALQALEN